MPSLRLKPISDFDDVLKVLGGSTRVGEIVGQSSSAVCVWRRARGQFPAKYYWYLKCALIDKGYFPTLDLFTFVTMAEIEERIAKNHAA
jgi:hypothetical protein